MRRSCWRNNLYSREISFSENSRLTSNKDIAIGLNLCGDYRRPSHGLALEKGALGYVSKTSALLEVISQRGIGRTCGRLFGNVVKVSKIAHGGVAVVAEGEDMETYRVVFLGDGRDGFHIRLERL